jgi:cytochrome P450
MPQRVPKLNDTRRAAMAVTDSDGQAAFARLIALDSEALACPAEAYGLLSERVTWIDDLDAYVVTGYGTVRAVLAAPEKFANGLGSPIGPSFEVEVAALLAELKHSDEQFAAAWDDARGAWVERKSLLDADPPLHTEQRALVNRLFTVKRVRDMEPAIELQARIVLDEIDLSREVDMVAQVAKPFPLRVIGAQLGLNLADLGSFERWSYSFVAPIGNAHLTADDLRGIASSRIEFGEYIIDILRDRRGRPCSDLLSEFANARTASGEILPDEDALRYIQQFVTAGHETTTNMITWGVRFLAKHPEVADRLAKDPDDLGNFVEEALRLSAPVQGLYRTAVTDTDLAGVRIPAGSAVLVSYVGANYDESEFACPRELNVERENASSHLSFGHGIHRCVGAPLARAEGRIIFRNLIERLYPWVESRGVDSVTLLNSYILPGASHYWVTFPR